MRSMAPVLAITGMVARACRWPFDPVGEIFQPFVTGPNRIPDFLSGETEMATEKSAKPQGEERIGAAVAIGRPRLEVVHPHAAGIDVGQQRVTT